MPDKFYRSHILICTDPECLAKGAQNIENALMRELEAHGLREEVSLLETSRLGHCHAGPEIVVYPEGTTYVNLTPDAIAEIVEEHLLKGRIAQKYQFAGEARKDEELRAPTVREMRIIMTRCGVIDPENIEDYIADDGYVALGKVLSGMTPRQVIDEVLTSGLRGRGGAGFPTGKKWEFAADQESEIKFVICNADEGDPGAFMNRRLLEGDPHAVLEGIIIAGYAIGAQQGYIYCRAEYPIAVRTIRIALRQARELGFLGKDILGSGFDFDIELRMGAGAFVCGEETALMASIEGRRGEPRPRPPFPAVSGLWGKPTIINNVETLANIPNIVRRGAEWLRTIGTEKSKGTKTFTLAGDVERTGLIEVPLGITLREVVFDVAGGIKGGRKFKAIQTGGPMGGCIPEQHLDTPLDYEPLGALGSIMGSGGLVVMDDRSCMVDIARFFMEFTQDESCGKCVPCRIGTRRILEILERICAGEGEEGDIERLENLSRFIIAGSLCGLGQGAPNPVLTTLKYFRHEYEAHIYEKRCPAGKCQTLTRATCVNACPAGVDVPAYLALVAQGHYAEALTAHRDANPFALICGRVCPAFCEKSCRRGLVDQPIAIRQIKRFMADREYAKPWTPQPGSAKNIKVAVVGAGPAGLTAALRLAQRGYQVTVFEKMPQPGGMMTYGIPAYRLPREPLFAEIDNIRRAGVDIRCNKSLGTDFTIQSLKDEGYQAIVLTIGAHKSRELGAPGEDKAGVLHAIQMLRDIALGNPPDVKAKRVIVVGGGDTAIDAARSSLRLGAREAQIVYRRTRNDMPALEEEVEAALEEGIQVHFLVNPVEVLGDQYVTGVRLQRQRLGDFDRSGRRRPVPLPGTEFDMPCDVLVAAVGQITVVNDPSLDLAGKSTFEVGLAFQVNDAGAFSAGDAVLGPATVVEAVAQGNKVALAVDNWLTTGKLERVLYQAEWHDVAQLFNITDYANVRRVGVECIPLQQRLAGFAEAEVGLDEAQAQAEARRCFRCDLEWLERIGEPIPSAVK